MTGFDVETLLAPLRSLAEIGGPVVVILLCMSFLAVAVALAKLWHFLRAGVGRHGALEAALSAWDAGRLQEARSRAAAAPSHLALVSALAMQAAEGRRADEGLRARLTSLAAERMMRLSTGFRVLDSIAQVAPLLGLLGTVLGMIEAFQAMQAAGSAVDPSALAGGIWVALLTTAVGLSVAMPTTLLLTWFEGRVLREAQFAERVIDTILCAGLGEGECPMGAPNALNLPRNAAHA